MNIQELITLNNAILNLTDEELFSLHSAAGQLREARIRVKRTPDNIIKMEELELVDTLSSVIQKLFGQ